MKDMRTFNYCKKLRLILNPDYLCNKTFMSINHPKIGKYLHVLTSSHATFLVISNNLRS